MKYSHFSSDKTLKFKLFKSKIIFEIKYFEYFYNISNDFSIFTSWIKNPYENLRVLINIKFFNGVFNSKYFTIYVIWNFSLIKFSFCSRMSFIIAIGIFTSCTHIFKISLFSSNFSILLFIMLLHWYWWFLIMFKYIFLHFTSS